MIKEYNQLIQYKHTHMEWKKILYGRKKKLSKLILWENTKMFNFDYKKT